jgi:hypothetical protein
MRGNERAAAAAVLAVSAWAVLTAAAPGAAAFESGPNISGEVTGDEHRARREFERQEEFDRQQRGMAVPPGMPVDPMRIVVPGGPDGLPQRPVRGLSRTEKMEMDDLEYRYQMGMIGEAEYFSRRNAIMQRVGLEPEF